ncbi:hypothetical protein SASPL_131086 [Salvia splendens]|uniref:Myb/SANT-like domain-containing protein n=1 Tax=Salvia splendens TaxID=180675 RepID=A0A8X8X780_SALSN|nr:hypothetical protein SASPL_131086 [Salvia splendens]
MNGGYYIMNSFENNLETQDNSRLGLGTRARGDRTRRSWSAREEEVLMWTLKDLVARGWKNDNGFRSGYLTRIEEVLNREFPKSGIKGTPHVNSKICQWKKSYNSLGLILGRSGVGFNVNEDYKIDCDDDQWSQIVKRDPNACGMRHRSWSLYDNWKLVFGKDRASGSVAVDTHDAHDGFSRQTQSQLHDEGLEFPFGAEEFSAANPYPEQGPAATPNESTGQSLQGSMQTNTSGKKRKAATNNICLIQILGRMQDDTNERLDKLTKRIAFEFDASKARNEVVDILSAMPELTLVQQIDVTEIILEKVEWVEHFIRLAEGSLLTYVSRALEKYGHI